MFYITKIPNKSTGSRIILYNISRIKNLLKNITAPLEVQPPPPSVVSILEECYSWWRWLATCWRNPWKLCKIQIGNQVYFYPIQFSVISARNWSSVKGFTSSDKLFLSFFKLFMSSVKGFTSYVKFTYSNLLKDSCNLVQNSWHMLNSRH